MLFLDLIVLKIKGDFCDFFRLLFQQILDKLPLDVRKWICPPGESVNLRDYNSSLNILAELSKSKINESFIQRGLQRF